MGLTPFTRPITRKRFTTYDLEWYPGTYKLRLVGVYDRDLGYRCYDTIAKFLDAELRDFNKGRTFFAHAGGLADVQFVLEELLESGQSYEIAASFSGSAAIIFQVNEAGGKPWMFCDSYWLMRDSLQKIAESMGQSKLKYRCTNFPGCGHFDPQPDDEDKCQEKDLEPTCIFYSPLPILTEYNAGDCRMLYEAIERLEEELLELGGELMMTIASTALRLFRRQFLKRDIPTSKKINELADEAYTASRVEVHRKRAKQIFSYDINSSFPHSLTKPLPGRYQGMRRWNEYDELGLVFAEVHVPVGIKLTPLPKRVDGRVYFPTGSWKGWFSGIDLQYLLRLGGRIIKVWQSHSFEPFDDTVGYVETIYELRRRETDQFRRIVYKYLLNSLYGKFAEGELKDLMHVRKDVPKGARIVKSLLGGKANFLEKTVYVAHAHVHISGITTSRSRMLLGDGMIEIGGVHYVDTDSVNSDQRPVELGGSIRTSDKLGEFKWEKDKWQGEEGTDYEGLAAKLYRIGDLVKAKGFSRMNGKKKAGRKEFDILSSGQPVEIRRMTRVKEVLAEADYAMRQDEPVSYHPHDVMLLKQVALLDRPKRRWLDDGGTEPWDVAQLAEPYRDTEREAVIKVLRAEAIRRRVV